MFINLIPLFSPLPPHTHTHTLAHPHTHTPTPTHPPAQEILGGCYIHEVYHPPVAIGSRKSQANIHLVI